MDAVISIGGQSFVDGVLRLIGPQLQALRSPIPIAVPGLSNGALLMRHVEPALPGAEPGKIELRVEFDLIAEALVVATLAAGNLTLSLGTGIISLAPSTGSVALPAGNAPLSLGAITGNLTLPATGDVAVPLPAAVPVAIDLGRRLAVSVFLAIDVTGRPSAGSGFGLELSLSATTVTLPDVSPTFVAALRNTLETSVARVVDQLGVGAVAQPALNFGTLAERIASQIPRAVQATLTEAFTGLLGRTGRLVYPAPGDGASCEARMLPTDARARLVVAPDGAPLLQVAFDRRPITSTPSFPAFTPAARIDVGVAISNRFLRDLLCCLLEKVPTIKVPPTPHEFTDTATESSCQWTETTVNVGGVAFHGVLTLRIQGAPGASKIVTLAFETVQTIAAGIVDLLNIQLSFTMTLRLDLDSVAAITNLRLAERPVRTRFDINLGNGLQTSLALATVGALLVPGVALAIELFPNVAVRIASKLLDNAVDLVLEAARSLVSPPALPPGLFDAFGKLVPISLRIDDLDATGVLQTPTSPFSLLPIARDLPVRSVVPLPIG